MLVCLVIASWHLDCSQTNLLTLLGVSLLYMAPFLLLISIDCFCYRLIDGSCIKLMLLCSTTLLFHFPFFPLPPLHSSNNLSFSHFSLLLFQTLCLQYSPLSLLFVFVLYYPTWLLLWVLSSFSSICSVPGSLCPLRGSPRDLLGFQPALSCAQQVWNTFSAMNVWILCIEDNAGS